MPINTIQIKRSKNSTLSSPSSVTLAAGELFYMKPATEGESGRLYVGDGTSNMTALVDIGYTDRQAISTNSANIEELQGKVGNWVGQMPMTSAIQTNEYYITKNTNDIKEQSASIKSISNLLTDTSLGLYYPTTDGKLPSTSNTSINVGNIYLSMNTGVAQDANWDSNISLDNPGEWKSGDKNAKLLHNSKIYGLDARVGKIFDTKFNEKGIFGKDFIINKKYGNTYYKVLEFIRGDNGEDTARIAGGEVVYGSFDGQQKPFFQSVNIKSSSISDSTITNPVLKGTVSADGATIQGRAERVKIVNPSIDNPIFSSGFINKYDYFQAGIVDTNAIKDASVTAAKLATGAIQASKILGKTGGTSILYSDTNGKVYWGSAPSTATAVSSTGAFSNYIAKYDSGRNLTGLVKLSGSSAVSPKFLNENGTWQEVSVSKASVNSAGIVKPYSGDFTVDSTGFMKLNRTNPPIAGHIAILESSETSIKEGTTKWYLGRLSNDGKTLVFVVG